MSGVPADIGEEGPVKGRDFSTFVHNYSKLPLRWFRYICPVWEVGPVVYEQIGPEYPIEN